MPYIPRKDRYALRMIASTLAAEIERLGGDYEGNLNYAITELIIATIPERRYKHIARITGVLENVKQEFYRRYAAPYEDRKAAQEGDVY